MCLKFDDTMFSALHLLRSYNQYIGPIAGDVEPPHPTLSDAPEALMAPLIASPMFIAPPAFPYNAHTLPYSPPDFKTALKGVGSMRRPRSEKKPIPEEQKDEKYYERRKRNNQAAKKSRDARRIREDHIALRANMLEHENAVLRAQVLTLREEAQSLRQLLLHRKRSMDNLDVCAM